MAMHGHVGRYMAMSGHIWTCMAIHGYIWPCLAMHGDIWPCLAMHGHIWPSCPFPPKWPFRSKWPFRPEWPCMAIHVHAWPDRRNRFRCTCFIGRLRTCARLRRYSAQPHSHVTRSPYAFVLSSDCGKVSEGLRGLLLGGCPYTP